jgi:hypothetical protein
MPSEAKLLIISVDTLIQLAFAVRIEIVSTTIGADSTHSGVEDRVHLGRVVRHYEKCGKGVLVDYTGSCS